MPNATAPTPLRLPNALEATIMFVTPQLAEEWLGRNDANRNLRPSRVSKYARDMRAGRWALTGEAVKFDNNGNLIDGQHRLTAVRDSGETVEMLIVRGLAPTVRGVIDTGARRSASDALRMAGNQAATRSMAATVRLLIAIRSGAVTRAGDIPAEVTHSEVIDFYDLHRELLDYSVNFANRNCRKMHARPSALAAAMFLAADRNLEKFTAFATSVAELRFGTPGRCPIRALYKRLESLRDESHQSSEEVYFILRAFAAHVDGSPLSMLKSSTAAGRSIIPTMGKAAA